MIALFKDKAVVDDVGIFFLLFDRFHAVVTSKSEEKRRRTTRRERKMFYEKTNNCVFLPIAEYSVQKHTERRAPGMP
jgi:hypothetical protein